MSAFKKPGQDCRGRVLINGALATEISVLDRGLAYGDGLFETLRAAPGSLPGWDLHMQRLRHGCERLNLPVPSASELRADVERLLAVHGEGVVKIIVTRGVGGRGYAPPIHPEPTRAVIFSPVPNYVGRPANGAVARLCELRLGSQPALAGIKHLNRLEQVLARQEWSDPLIHEGLMFNANNELIEGVSSNLLLEIDGQWITPLLSEQGVQGVTLNRVVQEMKTTGLAVASRRILRDELKAMTGLVMTNSVIGAWPITKLLEPPLASESAEAETPLQLPVPQWLPALQRHLDDIDGIQRHCVS